MRTLLSHGVATGGGDRDGYTPLHLACFCGHAKTVRLLLVLTPALTLARTLTRTLTRTPTLTLTLTLALA